jgi:hypothetical protein
MNELDMLFESDPLAACKYIEELPAPERIPALETLRRVKPTWRVSWNKGQFLVYGWAGRLEPDRANWAHRTVEQIRARAFGRQRRP